MTRFSARGMGVFLAALVFSGSAEAARVTVERAEAFTKEENWRKAEWAWRTLSKQDADNGYYWSQYATALANRKRYRQAISALSEANDLAYRTPRTRFRLACLNVAYRKIDPAYEWLESAVASGYSDLDELAHDECLDPLRDDPRFSEFLVLSREAIQRCVHEPEYHKARLRVGEWNIRRPDGTALGKATVEYSDDSCILIEEWKTGLFGKSHGMMLFDPSAKAWQRVTVNSRGAVDTTQGIIEGERVQLTGSRVSLDGSEIQVRHTWSREGRNQLHYLLEEAPTGTDQYKPALEAVYERDLSSD